MIDRCDVVAISHFHSIPMSCVYIRVLDQKERKKRVRDETCSGWNRYKCGKYPAAPMEMGYGRWVYQGGLDDAFAISVAPTESSASHPSLLVSLLISITVQTVDQWKKTAMQSSRMCSEWGQSTRDGHTKEQLKEWKRKTKSRHTRGKEKTWPLEISTQMRRIYPFWIVSFFFLFFFYKTQCHPSLKTTDWEREHLEWKSHFAWLPSDPLLCLLPCSDPIYRLLAIGPDAITTNIAMACFWLICRLENPIVSIFYGSASKKKEIKIEIFHEKTLHGMWTYRVITYTH